MALRNYIRLDCLADFVLTYLPDYEQKIHNRTIDRSSQNTLIGYLIDAIHDDNVSAMMIIYRWLPDCNAVVGIKIACHSKSYNALRWFLNTGIKNPNQYIPLDDETRILLRRAGATHDFYGLIAKAEQRLPKAVFLLMSQFVV